MKNNSKKDIISENDDCKNEIADQIQSTENDDPSEKLNGDLITTDDSISLGIETQSVFSAFSTESSQILKMVAESMQNMITESLPPLVEVSNALSKIIEEIIHIDLSPLFEILRKFSFDIDFYTYEKNYSSAMYEARWFPKTGVSIKLWQDINRILNTTKKSKNRIKKIDQCVFKYYLKPQIEAIKRSWKKDHVQNYILRILNQAINAYYKKEYAVTTIVLASLWEGIVSDKVENFNNLKSKEKFRKLIEYSDSKLFIVEYYEEYIIYNCWSKNEVISDVPGRNASMHGWYNKYPSKKSALNAILFTDFLLKLQPKILD